MQTAFVRPSDRSIAHAAYPPDERIVGIRPRSVGELIPETSVHLCRVQVLERHRSVNARHVIPSLRVWHDVVRHATRYNRTAYTGTESYLVANVLDASERHDFSAESSAAVFFRLAACLHQFNQHPVYITPVQAYSPKCPRAWSELKFNWKSDQNKKISDKLHNPATILRLCLIRTGCQSVHGDEPGTSALSPRLFMLHEVAVLTGQCRDPFVALSTATASQHRNRFSS
jgi:hypothetical protein